MSDNIIIHKIEAGDTLTSISQRTNIPLNMLYNIKGLSDVNAINVGDQIVHKNGMLVYENHLYDALTKPNPVHPSSSEHSSQVPTPTSENNNQENYTPTNNSNPNPDCPTGTCKESVEKCLIEVKVETKGASSDSERTLPKKENESNDNGITGGGRARGSNSNDDGDDFKTFYWKNINEKRIPPLIVYVGKSSETAKNDYKFKYDIEGKCQYDSSSCIKAEVRIIEYYQKANRYFEGLDIQGLAGEIDHLNFDEDKKVYGSISSEGKITPVKLMQDEESIFEIITKYAGSTPPLQALRLSWKYGLEFIIFSSLDKFPMNLRYFRVDECEAGSDYLINRIDTTIVSLPPYSHTFNGEISYNIKHELKIKGTYELKYNSLTLKLEKESDDLSNTFPWVNKITDVLKVVTKTKRFGSTLFPMAVNLHPPKLVAKDIKAELQGSNSGKAIKRSGELACEPLIGGSFSLDLLKLLSTAVKAAGLVAGSVVSKALDGMNLFDEVCSTVDKNDRLDILKGEASWWKARAAGYFYFSFLVDFGGGLKFQDSAIFDDKNVCVDMFLTANAKAGLYAGLWFEARVVGFGAGGGATVESEVKVHGKYYFRHGELIGWFGGIVVAITAEFSFGRQKSDDGVKIDMSGEETIGENDKANYGLKGNTNGSVDANATRELIIVVAKAGSEKDPMFVVDFTKEKDTSDAPSTRQAGMSRSEAMTTFSGMS